MMHELDENVLLKETVAADSYIEGSTDPSPTEVDIKDSQNVKLFVDAGTVNSTTDGLVVELHGADESGGSFTQLEDYDGNPAEVTLDAAGNADIEVYQPPRYVKVVVTQEGTTEDIFGAYILAGNAETLPFN